MSIHGMPQSASLAAKVRDIVESKQKTTMFEIKTFNPGAAAKKITKEFEKLHDPALCADSGDLKIVQNLAGQFDSEAVYEKAKDLASRLEPFCHVRAISVRSAKNKDEFFEIRFSFYDYPEAYKHRNLEM